MADLGEKWVSPDGSTWKVASPVKDGVVQLSGPGPCRSLIVVEVAVLLSEWKRDYDDGVTV